MYIHFTHLFSTHIFYPLKDGLHIFQTTFNIFLFYLPSSGNMVLTPQIQTNQTHQMQNPPRQQQQQQQQQPMYPQMANVHNPVTSSMNLIQQQQQPPPEQASKKRTAVKITDPSTGKDVVLTKTPPVATQPPPPQDENINAKFAALVIFLSSVNISSFSHRQNSCGLVFVRELLFVLFGFSFYNILTCMYACIDVCLHVFIYVFIYLCIYVFMYSCINVFVLCTHTFMHTHI